MNYQIHSNTETIRLRKAVLVYEDHNGKVRYASTHPVTAGDHGKPVIGAGIPVDTRFLGDAYRSLMGDGGLTLLSDTRILAFNGEKIAFWIKGAVRPTYFDCPEPMGNITGDAPHPSLIFLVSAAGGFSVFALKGQKKPNAGTAIYHAPYMNIHEDGEMCKGNIRMPEFSVRSIDAYCSAFFSSWFTHANNRRAVDYPGGIYSLWSDLIESTHIQRFPEDVLLPFMNGNQQHTLESLLARG